MRADRLVATLLLLQRRGRVTAREVATDLEVSVATARRDLEALGAAGIPVYPQAGRGGGWQLVGGARTDLTGLTAGEARALFELAGPQVQATTEVKSALRKLIRALPATFRDEAAAASVAVRIDPSRWGDPPPDRPQIHATLREAVIARRRVQLSYRGRAGATTRLIDPYGLVSKDDRWYLIAGTPAGQRTFRLDRVNDVTGTSEPFERPDDFDLDEAWSQIVDEMESRRSVTSATVRAPAADLWVLQRQFGRHCDVLESGEERVAVRLAASSVLDLARVLAGWGAAIEVIEPDDLRTELRRIGAELLDLSPPAPRSPR